MYRHVRRPERLLGAGDEGAEGGPSGAQSPSAALRQPARLLPAGAGAVRGHLP